MLFLKALSHIAGQMTGKRTKINSVGDATPVVNFLYPFPRNSMTVVSGRVPVEYRRRKRRSNGRGTEGAVEERTPSVMPDASLTSQQE